MAITPVFSAAVSGLEAASRRADVAADNIVNANTPGFRPARVAAQAVVAGSGAGPLDGGSGVRAQVAAGSADSDPGGTVATGFVELIRAETAFRAAAALVRTADQIAGETVDIVG